MDNPHVEAICQKHIRAWNDYVFNHRSVDFDLIRTLDMFYTKAKLKSPALFVAKGPNELFQMERDYVLKDAPPEPVSEEDFLKTLHNIELNIGSTLLELAQKIIIPAIDELTKTYPVVNTLIGQSTLVTFGYTLWRNVWQNKVWEDKDYQQSPAAFAPYFNISDIRHAIAIDILEEIYGEEFTKHKEYENMMLYRNVLRGGVFGLIAYEKSYFVCPYPTDIYRDSQGRLHNDQGPAILWTDDEVQHYLYGVFIPADMYNYWLGGMTTQEILKVDNQEIRSVLLRARGYDRVMDEINHRILDQYTYEDGRVEKVVELDLQDEPDECWARFLSCTCPSTERPYMLRLDPRSEDTTSVIGAQAWLAGKSKKTFKLGEQT